MDSHEEDDEEVAGPSHQQRPSHPFPFLLAALQEDPHFINSTYTYTTRNFLTKPNKNRLKIIIDDIQRDANANSFANFKRQNVTRTYGPHPLIKNQHQQKPPNSSPTPMSLLAEEEDFRSSSDDERSDKGSDTDTARTSIHSPVFSLFSETSQQSHDMALTLTQATAVAEIEIPLDCQSQSQSQNTEIPASSSTSASSSQSQSLTSSGTSSEGNRSWSRRGQEESSSYNVDAEKSEVCTKQNDKNGTQPKKVPKRKQSQRSDKIDTILFDELKEIDSIIDSLNQKRLQYKENILKDDEISKWEKIALQKLNTKLKDLEESKREKLEKLDQKGDAVSLLTKRTYLDSKKRRIVKRRKTQVSQYNEFNALMLRVKARAEREKKEEEEKIKKANADKIKNRNFFEHEVELVSLSDEETKRRMKIFPDWMHWN